MFYKSSCAVHLITGGFALLTPAITITSAMSTTMAISTTTMPIIQMASASDLV